MRQQEKTTVQRTLVLVAGPLAEEVGDRFQQLLHDRAGPIEAVAIVPANPAGDATLLAQMTEALTAISPPSLAADLAQKGWALEAASEMSLLLVLDAALYGAAEARQLEETGTRLLLQHLGLDATLITLWLVVDPPPGDTPNGEVPGSSAETLYSLLPDSFPITQGATFYLSLLNEEGLRLPDEATLAATAANALWALVATPLRRATEWLLASVTYSPQAPAPRATLGVACWSWARRQAQEAFANRWLRSLLACWLAVPDRTIEEEEVAQWLEYRQLDIAGVSPELLATAGQATSPYAADAWRAPVPWQITRLWLEMKVEEEAEHGALERLAEQLSWRLADWLKPAAANLRDHVRSLLDDHPVGGVTIACAWAAALMHVFDHFCATLCRQADEEAAAMSALASERGRFAGRLRELLQLWPQPNPLPWFVVLLRPWRWPGLIWRYLQLRHCGYQLSQIMSHQARLQRQQLVTATCRQGMAALHQEARRLLSQAEEIGDMLRHLKGQLGAGEDTNGAPTAGVPFVLYQQLVPDERVEAEVAAAAIGGLGRQLAALDDRILDHLRRLASERLAGLNRVTAVEALAALYPSPPQWQQWWQALWAEASPLWRYDETRISTEARGRQRHRAWACGAGVDELPRHLDAAVELPPDIQWQPSADRERILLLRLSNF